MYDLKMLEGASSPQTDTTTNVRWIVGVDGSPGSRVALQWAVAHGGHRASIRAVRAWRLDLRGVGAYSYPILYERELNTTQRAMADLMAIYANAVPEIDYSVVSGQATTALTYASRDAHLLVLGTRGRRGFAARLGSVSRYCATRSTCPVVIVPKTANPDQGLEKIVVGMDGSPNALAALSWALEFEPAASVRVVSAGTAAATFKPEDLAAYGLEGRAVSFHAIDSDPIDALMSASADADLVIVGARGRSQLGTEVLGSVSTAILTQAACPVSVIPRLR